MPEHAAPSPALSNKTYDILKFVALILMPALGALYFSLGKIWDFPNVEEVLGSITSIDTFLGIVLGLNNKAYNNSDAKYDGSLNIFDNPAENKKIFELALHDGDPEELANKDQIIFKVVSRPQEE
jgi:hypothetical protein